MDCSYLIEGKISTLEDDPTKKPHFDGIDIDLLFTLPSARYDTRGSSLSLNEDVLSAIIQYLDESQLTKFSLTHKQARESSFNKKHSLDIGHSSSLKQITFPNSIRRLTISWNLLATDKVPFLKYFAELEYLHILSNFWSRSELVLAYFSPLTRLKVLRIDMKFKPTNETWPASQLSFPFLETFVSPTFWPPADATLISQVFPRLQVLGLSHLCRVEDYASNVPHLRIVSEDAKAFCIGGSSDSKYRENFPTCPTFDVNFSDPFTGVTPLMHAIQFRASANAVLLAGADPRLRFRFERSSTENNKFEPFFYHLDRFINAWTFACLSKHANDALIMWPQIKAQIESISTQEWIDGDPIHPLIAAAISGLHEVLQPLLDLRQDWRWLEHTDAPLNTSTIYQPFRLLVFDCLIAAEPTTFKTFLDYFASLGPQNPLAKALEIHPEMQLFLAYKLNASKLSYFYRLPFLDSRYSDAHGRSAVHYFLESNPSVWIDSLSFDPNTFLKGLEVSSQPLWGLRKEQKMFLKKHSNFVVPLRALQKHLLRSGTGIQSLYEFVLRNFRFLSAASLSTLLRNVPSNDSTSLSDIQIKLKPFAVLLSVEQLNALLLAVCKQPTVITPERVLSLLITLNELGATAINMPENADLFWDGSCMDARLMSAVFNPLDHVPLPTSKPIHLISILEIAQLKEELQIRTLSAVMDAQEAAALDDPSYPQVWEHLFALTKDMRLKLNQNAHSKIDSWPSVFGRIVARYTPPEPHNAQILELVQHAISIQASLETIQKLLNCLAQAPLRKDIKSLWDNPAWNNSSNDTFLCQVADLLHKNRLEASEIPSWLLKKRPLLLTKFLSLYTYAEPNLFRLPFRNLECLNLLVLASVWNWTGDMVVKLLRSVSWTDKDPNDAALCRKLFELFLWLKKKTPQTGLSSVYDHRDFMISFVRASLPHLERFPRLAVTLVRAGVFEKAATLCDRSALSLYMSTCPPLLLDILAESPGLANIVKELGRKPSNDRVAQVPYFGFPTFQTIHVKGEIDGTDPQQAPIFLSAWSALSSGAPASTATSTFPIVPVGTFLSSLIAQKQQEHSPIANPFAPVSRTGSESATANPFASFSFSSPPATPSAFEPNFFGSKQSPPVSNPFATTSSDSSSTTGQPLKNPFSNTFSSI